MIFLILLLGLFVRLINLNQSLWLDEAISILAAKNYTFIGLITQFPRSDFHPPLYQLFLKIWGNIFGYSEIASRFPSIIFSLAAGYFIYLLGKKLYTEKIGLLASFFWIINPLAVYYAQEARMYSLAAFAVTAAVYFFSQKKFFWFSSFLVISLYTDYLPFLLLPVFFIFGIKNKKLLIAGGLSLIALLPWLPLMFHQFVEGSRAVSQTPQWTQVVGGFEIKSLPLTLIKFIIGRISIGNKMIYTLVMVPISLVYLLIMQRIKSKILWSWLLTPLILGFILSTKIPIFSYFRFLFVLPAFCLILAAGAYRGKFSIALISIIFLTSLISLLIFNTHPEFQRENWRSSVSYMKLHPGLILMPNIAQAAPIDYYYPKAVISDRPNLDLNLYPRIYLMRYVQEIFDPEDKLKQSVEKSGFIKIAEHSFSGVTIWTYQTQNK